MRGGCGGVSRSNNTQAQTHPESPESPALLKPERSTTSGQESTGPQLCSREVTPNNVDFWHRSERCSHHLKGLRERVQLESFYVLRNNLGTSPVSQGPWTDTPMPRWMTKLTPPRSKLLTGSRLMRERARSTSSLESPASVGVT